MESGKLNERITIKSHDGQISYDVWCNVRPVTTREQLRNSTVLANNLLTLQIRYLNIILTVIMNDDTSRIRNT